MHKMMMLWTCDICGKEANIEGQDEPLGWVQLGKRGFIDRGLCDFCAKKLHNRVTAWVYEHEEEPV